MATKIVILGQEPKEEKKLKPIEFVKINIGNDWIEDKDYCRYSWANIVLLNRNWRGGELDLMLAYNSNSASCLYLGHFNDGVVE